MIFWRALARFESLPISVQARGSWRNYLRIEARKFLVEPDTAMRKVAARVLADFATIKIRAGTAEQTARKIEKNWHRTPVEKLFGHDQMQTLCYPQSHTEGWEAFWGAARAGIEAPERHERDFARFEALNREVFEAFAVDSKIVIEYDSRVLFGQPRLK